MRIWVLGWLALSLLACAENGPDAGGPSGANGPTEHQCIDRDGDTHGDGCASGPDCDDRDPKLHQGCLRCALPNDGCACTEGAQPVTCFLDKTEDEEGTVMCHEGT